MISRPGRVLTHIYKLVNTTGREIVFQPLNNRRPCCATARLTASKLRPGESAEVIVELSVSEKFGAVVNEVEVLADPPIEGGLVLTTSATAHPAVRVEEESAGASPIRGGPPRRVALRVIAAGLPGDPPVDLDRLDPSSTIEARWDGPATTGPGDDGLTRSSRRLLANLDSRGEPGPRSAVIALRDDERSVYEHAVLWEVVAALTATPKAVAIRPDARTVHVLLQARDGAVFRVIEMKGLPEGIAARSRSPGLAKIQTVEIDATAHEGRAEAKLTVRTDHPAEPEITIPVIVLPAREVVSREVAP